MREDGTTKYPSRTTITTVPTKVFTSSIQATRSFPWISWPLSLSQMHDPNGGMSIFRYLEFIHIILDIHQSLCVQLILFVCYFMYDEDASDQKDKIRKKKVLISPCVSSWMKGHAAGQYILEVFANPFIHQGGFDMHTDIKRTKTIQK